MDNLTIFFHSLYKNFNERKIEAVISEMTEDVKWANGMDGGYVYGHDGVKTYWTRQFAVVSSQVTPLKIEIRNGDARISVHQVVHDMESKLLADETVVHLFHLRDGKICQFEIGERPNQ